MTGDDNPLAYRFYRQQQFAAKSSPLVSILCGLAADDLRAENSIGIWLKQVSSGRAAFDVPMLLMAAVHKLVLEKAPETAGLAGFYRSAKGNKDPFSKELPSLFRNVLMANRQKAGRFIQQARVQTNETGRGLCWLLPLCHTLWRGVHLVDLGASAGLNLLADMRNYRLTGSEAGSHTAEFGQAAARQFVIFSEPLPHFLLQKQKIPDIFSRTGCDLHPCILDDADSEETLTAFVWGDQTERLKRLREGVQCLQELKQQEGSVDLFTVDLPEELPLFLDRHIPDTREPVILYNTYLVNYLQDKGVSLRNHIDRWAGRQGRPVLWLQMELSREKQPPTRGYVLWQADLWHNGRHRHWFLGWCHPHLSHVLWLPGIFDFFHFFNGQAG